MGGERGGGVATGSLGCILSQYQMTSLHRGAGVGGGGGQERDG